jgi:putative transport protein
VVLGIFSGRSPTRRRWGPGSKFCAIWVPLRVDQMGMSYAMAYPFGICGILLTMWLVRLFSHQRRERGPAA